MKTFLSVLLIGLLGFLGCSGSNDGTSTFTGGAIPVAPFGIIDTLDPIYEWTPVPWATQYRLLVQDANETAVIEEWYTTDESGCTSEEVLCKVNPGIVTIGENTWKVQACANQVCGLWSEPLNYNVNPTPVSTGDRFIDNGDGTVTDTATGLIWLRKADWGGGKPWQNLSTDCSAPDYTCYDDAHTRAGTLMDGTPGADLTDGSVEGDWRLPTLSELYGQVTGFGGPSAVCGIIDDFYYECFTGVQDWYWTSTSDLTDPSFAWAVIYGHYGWLAMNYPKQAELFVWPVRSGN